MKLFYAPGACSLSPHIVLHEAGMTFDKVKVDTKSKAMEGGDYRSVNPLGYVPALELDDGTVLTEGPAIVQYIADKVPDKKLAPANGTLERTKLQSWLNFISTELHKGFSPLFNAAMPEEAKQYFRERLATRFQHLDKHLADKDYLLGKAFSVADGDAQQGSREEQHRDAHELPHGHQAEHDERRSAEAQPGQVELAQADDIQQALHDAPQRAQDQLPDEADDHDGQHRRREDERPVDGRGHGARGWSGSPREAGRPGSGPACG